MQTIARLFFLLASLTSLALLACSGEEDARPPAAPGRQKPVVYATFYPTQYFAERIGSDLIQVICPVPPGADPLTWKPDRACIAKLQQADLIILNGAGMEWWLNQASLPPSLLLDTSKAFASEFIQFADGIVHSHGPGQTSTDPSTDPHTWLDPHHATWQAKAILGGLERLLPEHHEQLQANFSALEGDFARLDAEFAALGTLHPGTRLLASHPAYNYLAARYGWAIRNLDLDPTKMPSTAQVQAIKGLLGEKYSNHLLWETLPEAAIAKRYEEELGLRSIEFSPCELRKPATAEDPKDYMTLMRENLGRLRKAFP